MGKTGSIGFRLAAGFALVLLLLLGVAALSAHFLVVDRDVVVRLADRDLAFVERVARVQESHMRQSVLVRDVVSYEDVAVQRVARKALTEEGPRFEAALDALQAASVGSGGDQRHALIAALREHHAALPGLARQAIDLVDDARFDEAKKLVYERVRPQQLVVDDDFKKLVAAVAADGRVAAEAARDRLHTALRALAALTGLTLLLGVTVAMRVTRSVSRPLLEAVGAAERVAAGDLATRIEAHSRDETGRLLAALAHMQDSLRAMVGDIRSCSVAVSEACGNIVRGSTDLSRRTDDQAAALEETASGMEQLTAAVGRNAQGAGQADEFTRESSRLAERGGQAVEQVVTTMAGISESATRIADIVSIIDGLAFQTNILALNAAVEAARAGHEGRGFAVVAAEVRSLAQRCAAAARDIGDLVSESRARVRDGGEQVQAAGETIRRMIGAFERLQAIMADIAGASREQASGIEQVNQTLTQLDGVTQRNARLVQESVASANGLQAQAAKLTTAVEAFTLGGEARLPAPAATALLPQRA